MNDKANTRPEMQDGEETTTMKAIFDETFVDAATGTASTREKRTKRVETLTGQNTVKFTFINGYVGEFSPTDIDPNFAGLPEIIRHYALAGFRESLRDSFSAADTVAEAVTMFQERLRTIGLGVIQKGRTSTGGIWAQAYAKQTGKALDYAIRLITALDDAVRDKANGPFEFDGQNLGKPAKVIRKDMRAKLEATKLEIEAERLAEREKVAKDAPSAADALFL